MRAFRRTIGLSSIAAAVLLLSACSERGTQIQAPVDDGSDGAASLLAVSWAGIADPIELTLTLDPVPLSGLITGSGVVGSVHAAFAFDVDGQINGSVVSMDFTIAGEGTVAFRGTLTTDGRIVGALNGQGFDQLGISLEPVLDEGGDEPSQFDPSQPQPGVSAARAGEYDGDWTVFIYASRLAPDGITVIDDWVEGFCSGAVTLDAQTLLDRLFGREFTGSYLMLDDGDCLAEGVTLSGGVNDGRLRGDGGFNFGLEIPNSDGNFFEDVLAGSGVKPDTAKFILLGCSIINKDLDNQMNGSILGTRLSAVASGSLDCPGLRGGTVNMTATVDMTAAN